MGMIINVDEALKLRTDYNMLREPLHAMLIAEQEAWERKNPIDLLFRRSSIDKLQETYTSSIGFDHAFAETGDYSVGPIFNTAEGFSATYRTRTFQGGFIITKQVLEDRQLNKVQSDATQFIKRWHGDIVEYCMTAIDGGFGVKKDFQGTDLILYSADTTDGKIDTQTKNPLFSNKHTIVQRKDAEALNFVAKTALNTQTNAQSNMYFCGSGGNAAISLTGDDPARVSKMADFINAVITEMENYRDDNGKRAGVLGKKLIVVPNDARLKAVITSALEMDMFGQEPNPAYKRAEMDYTPYLNDIDACAGAGGFFIVDHEYMAANHGLELTERIPLTLEAIETKRPYGITYDGRERFDVNVCTWRGIAYCRIGSLSGTATDWNYSGNFTQIAPVSVVKPVGVVGTVTTQAKQ